MKEGKRGSWDERRQETGEKSQGNSRIRGSGSSRWVGSGGRQRGNSAGGEIAVAFVLTVFG